MLTEEMTPPDNPSPSIDSNQKSSQKPKTVAIVILCLFLAFVCSDFFLHKSYMNSSSYLTESMQKALTETGRIISVILSGPLSYWIAPFLMVLPLITDTYVTTIYYYFLYFGQITLVVLLKATYGRGRPTIIGEHVIPYKCSCDYGMPSGHSSSAFMGFVILIDYFDRSIFKIYSSEVSQNVHKGLRKLIHFFCYILIVAICWSRLYLGVHSFNQVLFGFTLSLVLYLFFDRATFESIIKKMNCNIVLRIGQLLLIVTPLIVYIYYWVMTRRTQPTNWKYWSRCRKCEGTFAYKQVQNLAILFSIPAFLIGSAKNISFGSQKLENITFAQKTSSNHGKRFGLIMLVVAVFSIIAFAVQQLVPLFQNKPKDEHSKNIANTFAAYIPQIGVFYFLTFHINLLFIQFKVCYSEDFYQKCTVQSEKNRRELNKIGQKGGNGEDLQGLHQEN